MRRREKRDPEFEGLPVRLTQFRPADWPDFQPSPVQGVGVSSLFWEARTHYELKHGIDLPLKGPGPDGFFDPSTI